MTAAGVEDRFEFKRFTAGPSNELVTEDSAALAFVDRFGADLRYCTVWGRWYRWVGSYWRPDSTNLAFQWARELARELALSMDDRDKYKTERTAFATGVEKFARVDPAVTVEPEHWDADLFLLGTPDGTVDLRSGLLRPSFREDNITKVTLVSPNSAEPETWLRFLDDATGGDVDLIRFLQQWCGYALTGVTTEHALAFVYGPGGNGKSVFINVLTNVMKDYATTAAMETFAASSNDRHSTEVAMLRGARIVTASETEDGRAWAESRIKQMTGGDRVTARFMRQDNFTFIPQFKLTIVGNHKPILRNVDDAARRRFLIIPFERTPAKPDRELESKIMSEAPSVLAWMIRGCLDWQHNGLIRPQIVIDATKEYFADQDLFTHWLEEACEIEKGNNDLSEGSSDLFKSWKDFAMDAGNKPGTQQAFKDRMTRQSFRYYDGRRRREFFGIRLKPKLPSSFND